MATVEVKSVVTGSVWKIEAKVGQKLEPGDSIMILESMKMEHVIRAPADGEVIRIDCTAGAVIDAGQVLAVLKFD